MKIVYYSYDHPKNPWCGGGGAFRDLMIHQLLAGRHSIFHYHGRFKNAVTYSEHGISFAFLGCSINYLASRISYAFLATAHALFVKADLIVLGYSVFSPVLSYLLRRRITVIELFHLTGQGPLRKYSLFGIFPMIAERIAIIGGRHFICINATLADSLKTRFGKKSVATVYTGFDETLLQGKNEDKGYILYFGRIDIYMKGIDLLIDAFESVAAKHTTHRLILAGRGSRHDTEWLRDRIGRSSCKARISFSENVSSREKADLYHGATMVCMPSRFEGWCIAAIEAAACGKPTIGTRISGLSESIQDNETGILIAPENAHELAKALSRMLSDPQLRARLGSNGPFWAKRFTGEMLAKKQEEFYLEVASRQ